MLLTEELEDTLADRLVEETTPLAEAGKLGTFLVQLTPAFAPGKHDLSELDNLVSRLRSRPVAVELRHRAWVSKDRIEATLGWFTERGVAFVCVDAPPGEHVPIMPSIDAVTRDDLAYVRIHGRNTDGYMTGKTVAERFGWRYDDRELEEIGERTLGLAESAGDVHVMFNNNRDDDAPTAALRFRALLGQEPSVEEQLTLE